MKELVAQKAEIFDEYAWQSSVVEAVPDAVDRTEASMVQQVIDEETERLGTVSGPPRAWALACPQASRMIARGRPPSGQRGSSRDMGDPS